MKTVISIAAITALAAVLSGCGSGRRSEDTSESYNRSTSSHRTTQQALAVTAQPGRA